MTRLKLTLSTAPQVVLSVATLCITACGSDSGDGGGAAPSGPATPSTTAGTGGSPGTSVSSSGSSSTTGGSSPSTSTPSTGNTTSGGTTSGGSVSTGGTSSGGPSTTTSGAAGMSTGGMSASGGDMGSATTGAADPGAGGMPSMGAGGMDTSNGGTAGNDMGGPGGGMGGMMQGAGGMAPMAGADMGGADTGGQGGSNPGGGQDDLNSGENTMGWIGCSMGENTAAGYRRIGGTRMWGGFGNGGAVVQDWTSNTSAGWGRFDQQVAQYGEPVAVWIMICIFAQAGATAQEVNQMIENARSHSAPGVTIYLTGQPLYFAGHTCTLAGTNGPESTDQLAQEVAAQHDDVIYPGSFILQDGEVSGDSCHANTQGEDSLGEQARAFWGQP